MTSEAAGPGREPDGTGGGRWGALPILGATAAVAIVGARSTVRGRGLWYRRLAKPRFNPPDRVFGPVWTALYALMSYSAYRIWRKRSSPERTRALTLWGAQLGLNGLWSPLFFGSHRPRAALADLVGLAAAIGAYIAAAAKVDRVAALLMAPYAAWVSFAGVLNEEIVRLNRRRA
jgi:benzodiazapine receptor